MLTSTTYGNFEPITFQQYLSHFQGRRYKTWYRTHLDPSSSQEPQDITKDEHYKIYQSWLGEYHNKAFCFYRALYDRVWLEHQRVFKREYEIDDDDDIPHRLDEEWKEHWRNEAANIHKTYWDLAEQHGSNDPPKFKTDEGKLDLLWYILRDGPSEIDIDELWFNTTINNPPTIQAELKNIPYQDYLKSPHWQHLRGAMLLIGHAQCQEIGCFNGGDRWYGGFWESELDVHHLSYKNRGNERYRDLALLCKPHHKRWHESKKAFGAPDIKIFAR